MKLTEIAAYAQFDATLALIIYIKRNFKKSKRGINFSGSRRIVKKMLVDESGPQELSMTP